MVLVIIGLLIGGTLVGRELIHAAEMRSAVHQLERYQGAFVNFETRFNGLPGDLPNATFQMSSANWPDLADGDGDGYLEDGSADNTYEELTGELAQVWYQLTASRMLEEKYTVTPTLGVGFPYTAYERDGIGAYGISGTANYLHYGLQSVPDPGVDDSVVTANTLTAEEASYMDSKVDDGHPKYGRMLARGGTSFNQDTVYFDTVWAEPEHAPVYASLFLQWLVSPAFGADSATAVEREACLYKNSSDTDPDRNATYAVAAPGINCQLRFTIE